MAWKATAVVVDPVTQEIIQDVAEFPTLEHLVATAATMPGPGYAPEAIVEQIHAGVPVNEIEFDFNTTERFTLIPNIGPETRQKIRLLAAAKGDEQFADSLLGSYILAEPV